MPPRFGRPAAKKKHLSIKNQIGQLKSSALMAIEPSAPHPSETSLLSSPFPSTTQLSTFPNVHAPPHQPPPTPASYPQAPAPYPQVPPKPAPYPQAAPPQAPYPQAPPPQAPYPQAPPPAAPYLQAPTHPNIQVTHPVGKETIIIQQVSVPPTDPPVYFGKIPVELQCKYCRKQVKTLTTKALTSDGKLTCACLLIFCLLCAWLPCVCKGLYKIKHKCPACGALLGIYS